MLRATRCVAVKNNEQSVCITLDCSSLSIAVRTGLEPVTPCVTGMYSNQLN